jgi:16S rRNA (guanine527-N7)-methyltransferase
MTEGAWKLLPARALDMFGLRLSPGSVDLFRRYADELNSWAARMNLMSTSDLRRVVDRHILDSLSVVAPLKHCAEVVDFGAGAGFPGIPVAVVAPEMRMHLVESRRKRCTFLRHVARILGLANVRVWQERGEVWDPGRSMDAAVGRGLRTDLLVELSRRILAPAGQLLIMKKRKSSRPFVDAFTHSGSIEYSLPCGEEHEVAIYTRSA